MLYQQLPIIFNKNREQLVTYHQIDRLYDRIFLKKATRKKFQELTESQEFKLENNIYKKGNIVGVSKENIKKCCSIIGNKYILNTDRKPIDNNCAELFKSINMKALSQQNSEEEPSKDTEFEKNIEVIDKTILDEKSDNEMLYFNSKFNTAQDKVTGVTGNRAVVEKDFKIGRAHV